MNQTADKYSSRYAGVYHIKKGGKWARKALSLPLALALSASCIHANAFALGAGSAEELESASQQISASEDIQLSASAERPQIYSLYLPVLLRASGGVGEFESSYRASDASSWKPEYFIFDLGGNGIPELMVRTETFSGASLVHVFTIDKGKAVLAGSYWEWAGNTAGNAAGELFVAGWNQGSSYVNQVIINGTNITTTFLKSAKATEANPTADTQMVNSFLSDKKATWLKTASVTDYSILNEKGYYGLAKSSVAVQSAGEYNGTAKCPKLVVRFSGNILQEGKDYSIAYRNNINAGTGEVIVSGKGDYRGTLSANFNIAQADISKIKAFMSNAGAYTGQEKKPAANMKIGNVALRDGVDYNISYSNNINAGNALATIVGKGNFKGISKVNFNIARANIASIPAAVASGGVYNGTAKTPFTKATFAGKDLIKGIDYNVSYKNNKNAGTGVAMLIGKGNYQGIKNINFAIAKATNPLTIKAESKTLNSDNLSNKAQTFKLLKVKSSSTGNITYKNVSSESVSKKISINNSTGAITVKKGTKKGTYAVKVKVNAAGDNNYYDAAATMNLKIVVK